MRNRIETHTGTLFVKRFTSFATDIGQRIGEFAHHYQKQKKPMRRALERMVT